MLVSSVEGVVTLLVTVPKVKEASVTIVEREDISRENAPERRIQIASNAKSQVTLLENAQTRLSREVYATNVQEEDISQENALMKQQKQMKGHLATSVEREDTLLENVTRAEPMRSLFFFESLFVY